MIKAIVFDFSRVLLFPKDKSYFGSLNEKHRQLGTTGEYKALDHFELNTELLDFLKDIRSIIDLYIFTSDTIQDDPAILPYIKPIFNQIFSGFKLGLNKKDPNAYIWIADKLKREPEEILFIDDSQDNLDAAKSIGYQTIYYNDNPQLLKDLKTKSIKSSKVV